MLNGAPAMENSMEIPQKIKNTITIWSSKSTSGYMLQRIEIRGWKRDLYTTFIAEIIHNSQNLEMTQVSTDSWMDKPNVVYTYNDILFSL